MSPKSAPRPQPKPVVESRPQSLSVTEIELLLRDPYSIYARHVLRLQPLDAVDTPPGARDRGTVIHEAIGDFHRALQGALPADPLGRTAARSARRFCQAGGFSGRTRVLVAALPAHRALVRRVRNASGGENLGRLHAEVRGDARNPAGRQSFQVAHARRPHRATARRPLRHHRLQDRPGADRRQQVKSGLSPQLTLEGAILRKGGFDGIPAGASIAEVSLCRAARRRASRRAETRRSWIRRRPTSKPKRRCATLTEVADQIHRSGHRLSLARTPDVHGPRRRRLRPSRAREGMVAVGRRCGRGRATSNDRTRRPPSPHRQAA